jgi:hypothetical protein
MRTKMNVVGHPSPLPYLAASAFFGFLFLLQFYAADTEVASSFPIQYLRAAPYVFAGETALCVFPLALWRSAKHVLDTSAGKVVSSRLFVLRRTIAYASVYSLELNEEGLLHRIFHTCDVSFRDRYGRTLMIWSFLGCDDDFRRKIRRTALLISAVRGTAERAEPAAAAEERRAGSGDLRDERMAPYSRWRI